jgi:dienelactone hydrolase
VTKVLDAVVWLRTQPQSNGKVVIYGFSRGAELTMITGSLSMTEGNRPNALIAHAPSDVFNGAVNWSWYNNACWLCTAGIGKCPKDSPDSDFQWNLSCGPDDPNQLDCTHSAWLISGISIPANKRIEIEKYDGPILITVGDQDEVWPVDQTKRIEATLKEAGKKPEIHYFPGEGHGFKWEAELTRKELVLDFLQRVSRP